MILAGLPATIAVIRYVAGDHRSGGHHHVAADGHAGIDDRVTADPYIVPDGDGPAVLQPQSALGASMGWVAV